jgi:hypothetical protein
MFWMACYAVYPFRLHVNPLLVPVALIPNGASGSGWKAHCASALRVLQRHPFRLAPLLPDRTCSGPV